VLEVFLKWSLPMLRSFEHLLGVVYSDDYLGSIENRFNLRLVIEVAE